MTYCFDEVVDRRGTHAVKWNGSADELPMWVADMDFPTAPAVREAIERRAAHGIFGYTYLPAAWAESYADWWGKRHSFAIEPEWLLHVTGVISAIAGVIRHTTAPGDKILVQSPVYNMFYTTIRANGREVVENVLTYRDGGYEIDFSDLEARLADPDVRMMILCNPHNPIGKAWDRESLVRIGELCRAHGVLVLADEIHCDMTDPGVSYIPFASLSDACRDNSITCIAPTKSFNIAGLQTAAVVVADPVLRRRVEAGLEVDEVTSVNALAVDATIAAWSRGGEWLDALREYLAANKQYVRDYVAAQLPKLRVVPSDATYLLWLDVSAVAESGDALAEFLRREAGLRLCPGGMYGTGGETFLRLNPACPRVLVEEGMARLARGIALWEQR